MSALRNFQVPDPYPGLLAGMHQQMFDLILVTIHGLDDRRHFHEVGPCADNINDLHERFPFIELPEENMIFLLPENAS
jgi:hypothetical protein